MADLLAVRMWAQMESLWLTGLPTSVSGLRQGGLWRLYLLALDGFGLDLTGVAYVSAGLSLVAMLLLARLGARIGYPAAGRGAAVALFVVWATSLESSTPLNPCLVLPLATGLTGAACLAVARPGPRHHLLLGLMAALLVQVHPAALPLALAALVLPLAFPGPHPVLAGLLPSLALLASLLSLSKGAFLGAWVLELGPGAAPSDKAVGPGGMTLFLGASALLGLLWHRLPPAHALRVRRETAALFWLATLPLFVIWLLALFSGRAGEMRYLLAFVPAPVLLGFLLIAAHLEGRQRPAAWRAAAPRRWALLGWGLLLAAVLWGAAQRRGDFQELPQVLRYADVDAVLPHLIQAGIGSPREALCRLRSPEYGLYVYGLVHHLRGNLPDRADCDEPGDDQAVIVVRSRRPPPPLPLPGLHVVQTGRRVWTYITTGPAASRTLPFAYRMRPPLPGGTADFITAQALDPGRLAGVPDVDIVPLLTDAARLGIRRHPGPLRLELRLALRPGAGNPDHRLMVAPPWRLSHAGGEAPQEGLVLREAAGPLLLVRDIAEPRLLAPYAVLPFVAELAPAQAAFFREVLDAVP